jgi:hypothetical protein
MSDLQKNGYPATDVGTRSSMSDLDDDDRELEALGYVPSFKREFSNLATVRVCVAQNLVSR